MAQMLVGERLISVAQGVECLREVADLHSDLTAFIESDRERLIGLAYLLLANRSDAEDAVQTTLTHLSTKGFGHVNDLPSYVRRAVVNQCTSWKRSQIRREQVEGDLVPRADAGDLIDVLDLARALQRLSSKYRAVVVLRYYVDLDDAAIAAVLKCAPATVRSRLSRALTKLRSELAEDEQ